MKQNFLEKTPLRDWAIRRRSQTAIVWLKPVGGFLNPKRRWTENNGLLSAFLPFMFQKPPPTTTEVRRVTTWPFQISTRLVMALSGLLNAVRYGSELLSLLRYTGWWCKMAGPMLIILQSAMPSYVATSANQDCCLVLHTPIINDTSVDRCSPLTICETVISTQSSADCRKVAQKSFKGSPKDFPICLLYLSWMIPSADKSENSWAKMTWENCVVYTLLPT